MQADAHRVRIWNLTLRTGATTIQIGRASAIGVTIRSDTRFGYSGVGHGRHAVSRNRSTRRVIVSGDDSQSVYLARIAELEAEVAALTAELDGYKALAGSGATARLAKGVGPGALDPGLQQPAPPVLVNADGTQGMRRGVSGRRTHSPRDVDDQS